MKKLYTTILIALISINTFGQPSNWIWAKSATGTGVGQEAMNITTDVNGNAIIIGGYADSIMTFDNDTILNSHLHTEDSYIAKFSPSGTVLWIKSIGGLNSEIATSICSDINGNIYVTGYSSSPTIIFGSINLLNGANPGMFIVKYDSNGNEIWAKNPSGINYSTGGCVCADPAGNVIVTGTYGDTLTIGTTTLISAGGATFLLKFDTNGNLLWHKSEGGIGVAIVADTANNIILVGEYSSASIIFGSFTLTNSGGLDIYIVKYDSTGNVLWAKSGNGNSTEYIQGVCTDSNNNFFITGGFNSSSLVFDTCNFSSSGGFDVFIVKYNSSGNLLWGKSAGINVGNDYGYSVSSDGSGDVYLVGSFIDSITFNSTTIIAPTIMVDPMFIVKFDTSGNVLCADALGSGGEDAIGVSADNFGNAYITGDYSSNPIFVIGSDTFNLYGLAFIAKYNCNTSSESVSETANKENISIYPNPFTLQTTIDFSEEQKNTTIRITDVLGKEIKTINFAGRRLTIEKGNINAGIYFVQTTDEKKHICNKKIIIQ